MAADVARMLADLGNLRRDEVSDYGPSNTTREQKVAATELEARHQKINTAVTEGRGPRANALQAWNTPTTFSRDEATAQLPNQFSGQAHRRNLNVFLRGSSSYDEHEEARENALGEERLQYVRERGSGHQQTGNSNTNGTSNDRGNRSGLARGMANASSNGRQPTTAQDRFSNVFLGGQGPPPVPPTSSGAARGRPTTTSASNTRAPSPRSHGTTRFLHGQAVSQTPATSTSTSAMASATAGTPAMTNVQPRPAGMQTTAPAVQGWGADPEQLELAKQLQASHSKNYAPKPSSSHIPAKRQASTLQPARKPPSTQPETRTQSPSAKSTTSSTSRATRASDGGKGSKKPFSGMTPNSRPALANPAMAESFRIRALWYAANPGEETDKFHQEHPERVEFLERAIKELALKAIKLIKSNDDRETAMYIQDHPERTWMVEMARKATALVSRGTEQDIEANCNQHPRLVDFIDAARLHFKAVGRQDSLIADSAMWITAAAPERDAEDASPVNPVQVSEVVSTIHEEPMLPTSAPEIGKVKGTAHPTPITERNVDVQTSSPLLAQPFVAEPELKGTLNAQLYSSSADLVGVHQMKVQVPVHATVTVYSRSASYNPSDLIAEIEAFAKSMVDKTNGTQGARRTLVQYDTDSDQSL